jgi:hypothetical protein
VEVRRDIIGHCCLKWANFRGRDSKNEAKDRNNKLKEDGNMRKKGRRT